MFLSFWLRTKNDYFNVKSELTEKSVFKRQIKTEFIQGQDELISGRVSYDPNTLCYIDTSDHNRVSRSSSPFNDWIHVFMHELFWEAKKKVWEGHRRRFDLQGQWCHLNLRFGDTKVHFFLIFCSKS